MKTPQMQSDGFYHPSILGGAIEYDVDLKDVECGCNAALYMIQPS